MNYQIIKKSNLWFTISGILLGLSVFAFVSWGLNLGIDFTGGALLEVRYDKTAPAPSQVYSELEKIEVKSLSVQPADQSGLVLRFQNTDEAKHQEISKKLTELGVSEDKDNKMEELRFEAVGPSIGRELARNAWFSLTIVLLAIIIFVAWAFRRVSRPVASWKYGLAAVLAIFHDVMIVVGVFCYLGHFHNVEVNSAFVAALLTVLGYSVNDTIVVFDRIRERLPKSSEGFEDTVNTSLNQTVIRSFNTSLTVMLVLASIVIFGGDSIRYFALALFVGIFFGTYSSIFIASPLLVWFHRLKK